MSQLIDVFVKQNFTQSAPLNTVKIDSRWYLAKPIPYTTFKAYIQRFKDAVNIIRGRAIAIHYIEDTLTKDQVYGNK